MQPVRVVALWAAACALGGVAVAGGATAGYGRNLVIKTLPAVEDYQSNVYEVFMEPYLYEPPLFTSGERVQKQIDFTPESNPLQVGGGVGVRAVVYLREAGGSGVGGRLELRQTAPHLPVALRGNISGLSPGRHGLHIHHTGDIHTDCHNIGPHFIAFYGRHGGPRDAIRHVGDLGNIEAREGEAETQVKLVDHVIALSGPRSVAGRALAVTRQEDDYGRANTEESALTGSSGPPLACGVIAYLN